MVIGRAGFPVALPFGGTPVLSIIAAMAIQLQPNETVLFPAPYVPTDPALTIITTNRIVNFGDDGRVEVPMSKVTFSGKITGRPFLVIGIILALFGAPFVVYGALQWNSVRGLPTFEEQPPPPGVEATDPADVRIKAVIFAVFGALFIGGGYLCVKKIRYLVMCRGDGKMIKLKVKDEMQQNQVLMTIQAMLNAAKQQQAPPA